MYGMIPLRIFRQDILSNNLLVVTEEHNRVLAPGHGLILPVICIY
jgi:hypothetical protein